MNRLSTAKRVQVVAALVEGTSINAICRMTGVAKHTVLKLIEDIGCASAEYHHRNVRGLKVRRLQADEIWAFCGAKAKNVSVKKRQQGWGDVWTWTAIDADTKLCVSYLVGGRSSGWAMDFMQDCRDRISNSPQITTDAHKPYLKAVEAAFGGDANYAVLHKVYGYTEAPDSRYSPATCIGCDMKTISGVPDPKHVSTSFVERQNLTMRMSMRRFTRLTNGFSKKIENHGHAVALHFMYYNFVRVHKTLRVTPAMEAGIANHVWTMEELVWASGGCSGGCRVRIKPISGVRCLQLKRRLVSEVYPMMPAHDVAKYFVSLVDEEAGDSISNLKLQKLLYYAQGVSLALHDEAMFPEPIEAWTHGPVVPAVYHSYKQHRGEPIPVERVDLERYSAPVQEILNEVNEVFAQFSALKLRAMTHNEAPWNQTPRGGVISLDLMREFFKTMVIPDDPPQAAAK